MKKKKIVRKLDIEGTPPHKPARKHAPKTQQKGKTNVFPQRSGIGEVCPLS